MRNDGPPNSLIVGNPKPVKLTGSRYLVHLDVPVTVGSGRVTGYTENGLGEFGQPTSVRVADKPLESSRAS
jgi:hypothetical protein